LNKQLLKYLIFAHAFCGSHIVGNTMIEQLQDFDLHFRNAKFLLKEYKEEFMKALTIIEKQIRKRKEYSKSKFK